MTQRHVLITRLTAMGDVAMTAPIITAACKAHPDVLFDVLSTPFFEPFFEPLPNLRFLGTNIRKERHGIPALWRLFQDLRHDRLAHNPSNSHIHYDDIIDLHDVLRTKVLRTLFRLTGSNVHVINKGRSEKHRLVSGKSHKQLTPTTSRYAQVFRDAHLPIPDSLNIRPRQPLPHALDNLHKGNDKWIGISPFAQHRGKMYPLDRMTQVIDLLLTRPDIRIFIFGGGTNEQQLAQSLTRNLDRCSSMIGVMSLSDEMALMSNLDIMLSMDSSAMHVSSLFGIRVISLWGATHPYAGFLGYGQSPDDCLQRSDINCRPCSIFGNKPCRFSDYHCFDIPPQSVANHILNSL